MNVQKNIQMRLKRIDMISVDDYFTEEKEFASGCSSLAQYLIVFNNINIKENVVGIFDKNHPSSAH